MSNTDLVTQPLPALVLFGRDEAGKPHAAWFDAASTALATKAAGMMSMRAVSVESEPLRELAGGLPQGRIFASGRAFTPFVKAKLFEQLANLTQDLPNFATLPAVEIGTEWPAAAAGSEPATTGTAAAAGEGPASPEVMAAPKRPTKPEEIGFGSTVLATTGPAEGWFEADVIGFNGTMLTLKWQDYPGEPNFVRRRHDVGFLPTAR